MNASDARRDLYALVKRAEDDGVTTLIHRMGSKREDRVLLTPLDRFPAARKADAFPSWALSAAQKDFGTLVSQAASGQPQVLRRTTRPSRYCSPPTPTQVLPRPTRPRPPVRRPQEVR
ncbi:hypothetical protein HEP87_56670 [Streptomyces sp. S1D4-11]